MADRQVQIYVTPEGIGWDGWHSALIHDFGSEPLPHVGEENWSQFADTLINLPSFGRFDIPSPSGFANWQEWASLACQCVNGASGASN